MKLAAVTNDFKFALLGFDNLCSKKYIFDKIYQFKNFSQLAVCHGQAIIEINPSVR